MAIVEDGVGGQKPLSPQLPLQIPSGRVHVYFVSASKQDKTGVERTTIYFTVGTTKFKWMARNPNIRKDLIALGQRSDLADVDEEFSFARGGAMTVRIVPKA